MKSVQQLVCEHASLSLSSRRAWIEMACPTTKTPKTSSRSPHGERGLKSTSSKAGLSLPSRSPHGERGLKCQRLQCHICSPPSLSSRRAWIEMRRWRGRSNPLPSRSPHGERGLKLSADNDNRRHLASLSSRRAWIEISAGGFAASGDGRSPHGERGLKSKNYWP